MNMVSIGVSSQVVTPLAAAVIGAIIGGIFTFLSTYYIHHLRVKQKKKRLQRTLIGEIRLSNIGVTQEYANEISDHLRSAFREETKEELDTDWLRLQIKRLENTAMTNLKSDVYEENLHNIGLFNTQQIDSLLRYYHLIDKCREEVQELQFQINNNTLDGGDAEGIKQELHQLEIEKSRLLDALNSSRFEASVGFANSSDLFSQEERQ